MTHRRKPSLLLLLVTTAAWLAGCGSSDSSPPAATAPVVAAARANAPTDHAQPAHGPRPEAPFQLQQGPPVSSQAVANSADPAPEVQRIYRPDDSRPQRDEERALEFGVRKYESERLILYSDLDPALVAELPAMIDDVYEQWVDYFGELPPNRAGTPYQLTGYLIDDPQRFVAAGMLPEGPPMFRFGRHLGAEFWLNKMNSDYYRRHLLIHEATHCYMTAMSQQYPPRWYLEGMAEYFGTHVIGPEGQVICGVMPQRSEDFPGLGRIELIQQELVQGEAAGLSRLGTYATADWDRPHPVPYAWSWAVCKFLEDHPRYHQLFRGLGQQVDEGPFLRYMAEQFEPRRALLEAEWAEFARRLVYGCDVAANAFVVHEGPLEDLPEQAEREVVADRGWQSSGLHVRAGETISFQAQGDTILGQHPRPWYSQPQGISVRYAAGKPIGQLLGAILPDRPTADRDEKSPFVVFPIGPAATIKPDIDGELWLRVNDTGDGLADNTGSYQVRIRKGGSTAPE